MSDRIDIYTMDLDCTGRDVCRLSALLDAGEKERAQRFLLERDCRRYITRHAWLRELLSHYLGRSPKNICFGTNEFGKPFVKNGDLRFNMTCSANVCLVAITPGLELGCDVERRDSTFPTQDIARSFFSPAEVRALRKLNTAQQIEAFFNCWTRKEAYIKARGYGISLPLDSFDVSLTPGQPATLLRGCTGWSVQSFEPLAGYQAAVVAEASGWQLSFRTFDSCSMA